MIAVDTNLLVYALNQGSEWHPAAKRVLRVLAEGTQAWAIPWPCLHEFLAVTSNPRLFGSGANPEAGIAQMDAWMESPSLRLIGETAAHWLELKHLLRQGRLAGGMIHDARIAAICLENGVQELWTADRDFSRMPAITIRNPLIEAGVK